MDNSEKIIQSFKKKFDSMSPEERKEYLDRMGLKYRKNTDLVPIDSKLNVASVVTKVGHKRVPIPDVDIIKIINGDHSIPVCVFSDGKLSHDRVTKQKTPSKKIKGVVKSIK